MKRGAKKRARHVRGSPHNCRLNPRQGIETLSRARQALRERVS